MKNRVCLATMTNRTHIVSTLALTDCEFVTIAVPDYAFKYTRASPNKQHRRIGLKTKRQIPVAMIFVCLP